MDVPGIEHMRLNAKSPAATERQRAEAVAQDFEAVFVRTLVGSLRQSATLGGEGGMFGSGPGADTYADWFDEHLATSISKNGRLGIAQQLMREFDRDGKLPANGPSTGDAAAKAMLRVKGGLDVAA